VHPTLAIYLLPCLIATAT